MRILTALLAALWVVPAAADPELETRPQSLGPGHCHELWSKPASFTPGKLAFTYDLGDAGRAAYEQACLARGGVPSLSICPRANVVLVCAGEGANATANTILYANSTDRDRLRAACAGGAVYEGKRVASGLRARPGRRIWGSCLVE